MISKFSTWWRKSSLRSWWQQIRQPWIIVVGVVGIVLVVSTILISTGYRFDWTGFKGKTLWDWLNLLGVLAIPVVVGLGATWYTAQQGKVSDRENTDNQRETALQVYFDKMSELLLIHKLRASAKDNEIRRIARARTLTVLPRLDRKRKRSLLQFLYESCLLEKADRIVDLTGVDLTKVDLTGTDLNGVNLSGADLSGADLSRTNLSGANLSRANLSGANLSGALLGEAELNRAIVTLEQLEKALSLKDATMPDGLKYP
jgi:Pentapeptide repeats (8 copies)